MSLAAFFTGEAEQRTAKTIAEVEAQTSAEIVVAVRRRSARYAYADYRLGLVFALVTLVLLLFLPQEFALLHFPLDVTLAFVAGTALSSSTPGVKRFLAGAAALDEAVRTAARACFYDLGISRTSERTGVLIYVSMLEKRVEVVPDLGLDSAAVDGWDAQLARLSRAVKHKDLDAFESAVAGLGPLLAPLWPRGEDDVNELPDAVDTA